MGTIKRLGNFALLAKDAHTLKRNADSSRRQEFAEQVVARLGAMHGLPQKVAQLVGMSGSDLAEEFATLNESASTLPLTTVRRELERQWQRPVDEVLQSLSPHGKAASLGQVHSAVLRDGRKVAIKLQYPGIDRAIRTDLNLLNWLSLPVGGLARRSFDTREYRDIIGAHIQDELDYRQEARNQLEFAQRASVCPWIVIPGVVDDLSTEQVLVTDWEDGEHWATAQRDWTSRDLTALAQRLVDYFHASLLEWGIVHADWHAGNLRFRRTADGVQLVLFDFGSVFRPALPERLALLRLIRALRGKTEPLYPILVALGFDANHLHPLRSKLPALCRVLLEPYEQDWPYDVGHWRMGERVGDILGDDRWTFRVAAPARLIYLMRAYHGLLYYVRALPGLTNWWRCVAPQLSELSDAINRLELPAAEDDSEVSSAGELATQLQVQIFDGGQLKFQIAQRANAVENLDSLLDDELRERIAAQDVPLQQVVISARQHGYRPGELLRVKEGEREIVVRLL
ncbi:MAG: hypothetical protein KDB14_34000 [Planctomycetales bacterium]|nr:hypothetical protein [Planctomycetales bacterium]